jgi:glutamin-(asparagin-)ase
MSATHRPNLVLIGTGGTIAGRGASAANTSAYDCSVVSVADILADVPIAASLANIRTEQLLQIGSENFGTAELLLLGQRISALLKQDDVDGIVVTHGTDTLDETAYFLHLTLKSAKPVVVVGAMRPPSALSSDGPLNLYNALVLAASPQAFGMGTLVIANDEIHTARDVVKTSTFKLEAFRSPHGPLGYVVEGRVMFYRLPARAHTLATEWAIDALVDLPQVGIVYGHGGIAAASVDGLLAAGVSGIVYAATGNGNVATHMVSALRAARAQGVQVLRASRTGSGVVIRNGAQPDDRYDWLASDDQTPHKARLLLMLALTATQDTAALQQAFLTY